MFLKKVVDLLDEKREGRGRANERLRNAWLHIPIFLWGGEKVRVSAKTLGRRFLKRERGEGQVPKFRGLSKKDAEEDEIQFGRKICSYSDSEEKTAGKGGGKKGRFPCREGNVEPLPGGTLGSESSRAGISAPPPGASQLPSEGAKQSRRISPLHRELRCTVRSLGKAK